MFAFPSRAVSSAILAALGSSASVFAFSSSAVSSAILTALGSSDLVVFLASSWSSSSRSLMSNGSALDGSAGRFDVSG